MKNTKAIIIGVLLALATTCAITVNVGTRSAEAQVIPPPSIAGRGTTRTVPMFTTPTRVGDSSLSQDADNNLQTSKRMHVIVDLNDPGEDPALKVTTNGTNIGAPVGHALDGGVQSFHHGSYNTTGGQRQSFAGLFSNDSTVASGSGGLIATGIEARASGGTENYSFKGSAGTLRNDDDAVIGKALTVGPGTAAATGETRLHTKLLIDNTAQVSLGNTVDPFMIPGAAGTNPTIALGYTSAPAAQLATKNTNTGGSFGGLEVHLDTTVTASARGGLQLYRGAGGTAEVGGVNIAAGGDFAVGSNANDLVIHSYDPGSAGRSILFGTGATPSGRARFTTGGDFQMPISGQTGHLTDIGTSPTPSACGSGPTVSTGAWSFNVTTGTGATGCVLTFSKTMTNAPTCTVTSRSGTNAAYSISATAVTLGAGTAASATYDIVCVGHT